MATITAPSIVNDPTLREKLAKLDPDRLKIKSTEKGDSVVYYGKDLTTKLFALYSSRSQLWGMPYVSYAYGRDPETRFAPTARGVLAYGQRAIGMIAIAQIARGWLAIGQFAMGAIAIGQLAIGIVALGQFGLALFAAGQIVAAIFGAGQIGMAVVGYFQLGVVMNGDGSIPKSTIWNPVIAASMVGFVQIAVFSWMRVYRQPIGEDPDSHEGD